MQLTPPCLGPACWWTTQESGLLLRWQLQLGAHSVGFLFLFFFFSWLCCPLRFQNSPKTCLWEGFLLFGNFSFMTPSKGWVSVPTSFVSLFVFYIFSYLLSKTMGAFLVLDVLCQHSKVVLWNLLRVQMFFWWICGEKVVSLSYSSAILGLPSPILSFITLICLVLSHPS